MPTPPRLNHFSQDRKRDFIGRDCPYIVVTMEDCEEYLARLPNVYKRDVIRSFKEHRPLDMASLADVTIPPETVR